jgi:hypothetical protein
MKDPWDTNVPAQKVSMQLDRVDPNENTNLETGTPPKAAASIQKQRIKQDAASQKQTKPELVPQTQSHQFEFAELFKLNLKNPIQGVIWAEILGKPKAKRGR